MKLPSEMTPLERAVHELYYGNPSLSGTHALAQEMRNIKLFWNEFTPEVQEFVKQRYDVRITDGEVIVNA